MSLRYCASGFSLCRRRARQTSMATTSPAPTASATITRCVICRSCEGRHTVRKRKVPVAPFPCTIHRLGTARLRNLWITQGNTAIGLSLFPTLWPRAHHCCIHCSRGQQMQSTQQATRPACPPKVRSHETIHRIRVKPSDVGDVGFVDGGALLEWIDKAAHATATQWCGGNCVAASVGNLHLDRPIASVNSSNCSPASSTRGAAACTSSSPSTPATPSGRRRFKPRSAQ